MNAELAALLTRANIAEAQRQTAVQRGDVAGEVAAEAELRALARRHRELTQDQRTKVPHETTNGP